MANEIRHQGRLLGHWDSEAEARAHAKEHYAHYEGGVSVAPRRPVELLCRGNLVDTFDDRTSAELERDRRIEAQRERAASRARSRAELGAIEDHGFTIVDTREEPPAAPEIQPESA